MSWMKMSATNSTTPTTAIVEYWRLRYARAPSCTAAEIETIFSLPGESASSERTVTAPYTSAQAAHTSATRTPWSLRKLDKTGSSGGLPLNAYGAHRGAPACFGALDSAHAESRAP